MFIINCLFCRNCLNKSLKHIKYNKRFLKTVSKQTNDKNKYSKTVLLPKSSYPLKHSRSLELDPNNDISVENFVKLADRTRNEGSFVLHDGPPYANGSLHFGHAINKFLKDIICRRKLLEGFDVSYVPGWDCHGLPIELKAVSSESQISNPIEIRRKAKQFAEKVISEHKTCFRNWGIIGDWDNPYLTFNSVYVRNQIEAFDKLLESGHLFRNNMPVYWSPKGKTALAEAELQYNEEHLSKSVFVGFKLIGIPETFKQFKEISALIWTTTPWTLLSNQAIAYSSDITYSVVSIDKFKDQYFLVSKDLIPFLEKTFDSNFRIKQVINGSELRGITYKNPISIESDECLSFLEGSHVTTTKGTGLVHIAPNHGLDDYKLIVKNHIPIKECTVDETGRYTLPFNPLLNGKFILKEGNDIVIQMLSNSLLLEQDFIHSYPYDWRYNEPVIVRASPQWFINIENIRNDCINAVENVVFYPDFYKDYLINQLKTRPNWCISRQRSWGVPIPVFYKKEDKQYRYPLISKPILDQIINQFEDKGCDVWWTDTIDQLVPKHLIERDLKLYSDDLMKGKDIFDIWFDSGISWKTALNQPNIADMYLEGYDQLRGWFQSSLILSVALRGCSPYKSVKIHGFALDGEGKKMSKSIGNVIDPNGIIEDKKNPKNNCGSDGFRWWVAKYASDHKDQRVVVSHFDETLININRIRLTLRFLIGVLNDFNVSKDVCDLSEMNILDKYVLHLLHQYLNQMTDGYNDFNLIQIIDKSLKFIVTHISGFYLTRIRHRLYCDQKTSLRRRSCQTVILYLYNSIVFQLAPVLPHIMIEANNHLPIDQNFIKNNKEWNQQNIEEDMNLIISMTDLINKQLFGKHLIEYNCFIHTSDTDCVNNLMKFQTKTKSMDSDLCELLLMSCVVYNDSGMSQRDGITLNGCSNQMNYELLITSADNNLCHRCRRYTALNGSQLCDHCRQVLALN